VFDSESPTADFTSPSPQRGQGTAVSPTRRAARGAARFSTRQRIRRPRSPRTTVALLDDDTQARRELRDILNRRRGIQITGEAGKSDDLLRLLDSAPTQIVVMDVLLRREQGLEVIRRIRRDHPETRVVVLTNMLDEAMLLAALRAGAHAYLDRMGGPVRVAEALRMVAAGERILPDQRAITHVVRELERLAHADVLLRIGLSPEERHLLTLIADGHNNQAIAERLGVSLATVKRHLTQIFGKLQTTDRNGAISEAMRQGVL
jgi:DNA-binding NarL/FixJ family response regulator